MEWVKAIDIFIPGKPRGEGRPRSRIAFKDGRPFIIVYPDNTAKEWKKCVQAHFEMKWNRPSNDSPCRVDIFFYLPRPKKYMRNKDPNGPILSGTSFDRDNLDKAVLDAMQRARVFENDSRVAWGTLGKMFHAKDGEPGARVVVSVLGPVAVQEELPSTVAVANDKGKPPLRSSFLTNDTF